MIMLKGQMLSQLFSSGAYSQKFEFRSAELKGMIRYMYRIAYQGNLAELKKSEAELFGGAVGSIDNEDGHASPIKLVVTSRGSIGDNKLLLHKKESYKNEKIKRPEPILKSPKANWVTIIKISENKRVKQGNVDLEWYRDLLILTLMICGVGKRSRKGRGRIKFKEQKKFDNLEVVAKWICEVLNKLTDNNDVYNVKDEKIEVKNKNGDNRPTILEIRFGAKLDIATDNNNKTEVDRYLETTNQYLKKVDNLCHDWKSIYTKKNDPIGMGSPRFASSLIIGFVHTEEGIYPIYTFVKAVRNKTPFDMDLVIRNEFFNAIEGEKDDNNVGKGGEV